MSNVQHPYDDEEIAYRRAWPSIHYIDSRNADMRNERDRWLATYDALSARVAKLEAALRDAADLLDEAKGHASTASAEAETVTSGAWWADLSDKFALGEEKARAALEDKS